MSPTPNSSEESSNEAEVERLVFRCLEAPDLEEALDAVQRDYPELAERVGAVVQTLRSDGFLGDGTG